MAVTGAHNQAAGHADIQHFLQPWPITGSGNMYGGWQERYLEHQRGQIYLARQINLSPLVQPITPEDRI
jgi:hypothetical protein